MTKIGLISDTHGYIDERILYYLRDRDIIFHAGDIGSLEVTNQLQNITQLYAVYGNIDGKAFREIFSEECIVKVEELTIFMIHIGGYPGKYKKGIKEKLKNNKPDIFICGHSHILKVMNDQYLNLLHINPGAAGKQGFHKKRTLINFEIEKQITQNMKVIELGDK